MGIAAQRRGTIAAGRPGTFTFGNTTTGDGNDAIGANFQVASMFTLSGAGTVSKLSMYLKGNAANQVMKAAIWDDSAASPNNLKAQSAQVTILSGAAVAWVDFAMSVALTAGDYWLGFIAGTTTGGAQKYFTTVAGAEVYRSRSYASDPANPFGAVTGSENYRLCIYATLA